MDRHQQSSRTLQETVTTLAPAEVLAAAKTFFARRNPIYAAFLSWLGRFLALQYFLWPYRLSGLGRRAYGALLRAAGALRTCRTTVGDRIEFVQIAP